LHTRFFKRLAKQMKQLILIAELAILAGSGFGQTYWTNRIGPYDYTTGSNGYQSYGTQIGPYHYQFDNRGNTSFGQDIGPYHYENNYNSHSNYGLRHYQYNPYGYGNH
jgi:hypothetical protein